MRGRAWVRAHAFQVCRVKMVCRLHDAITVSSHAESVETDLTRIFESSRIVSLTRRRCRRMLES